MKYIGFHLLMFNITKLKLNKNKISINEIKEAISIQEFYLKSIGIDPITNKVDIAKAKGIPETANRRHREIIKRIIARTINESLNGWGIEYIERAELKELFINETGYKETTFKNRLNELKNNKDIIIKGNKIYLNPKH